MVSDNILAMKMGMGKPSGTPSPKSSIGRYHMPHEMPTRVHEAKAE